MIRSASQGDDRLTSEHATLIHGDRLVTIRSGSVAELAAVVIAPSREGAVGAKCEVVIIIRRDGDYGLTHQHTTLDHLHGHVTMGVRTVAEFAELVATPGSESAVGAQRQTVRRTCRDGDNGLAGKHSALSHGYRSVTRGVGSVAELAVAITAPCSETGVAPK